MRRTLMVLVAVAVLSIPACKSEPPKTAAPDKGAGTENMESPLETAHGLMGMFGVLPAAFESADNPQTDAKVALGRKLYYDKRFSKNHDISCNTCHLLDRYGVDGTPTSKGHKGQLGPRNSPTVYNTAGQFVQFWDGRAANVEEQAKGPVLNPVEMAMPDAEYVLRTLRSIPGYVEEFAAVFPGEGDAITFDHFAQAVGAFERKLVTPGRWDAFQGGRDEALTEVELIGLRTFVDTGCTTCHMGPLVGGTMYHKLGLVEPWPKTDDQGRFQETKSEADRMMFKVPQLRNIAKTGPYFHDGSTADLSEAVKLMARHQLGKKLDDGQVRTIIAWLDSLTGDLPVDLIQEPTLPEAGPETPAADPS